MTTKEVWKASLSEAQEVLTRFAADEDLMARCQQFSLFLLETFQAGGNVFSCGNGGSHCDAMHFAEEWTGRYRKDRPALGALALGDASHVTCTSNDYGFDHVFARQLAGLGRAGDLLVALSTSGNSKNLVLAIEEAKQKGIRTVGLLGRDGGKIKSLVDLAIVVPAHTSDRIQEIHIKVIHTVIESVERILFPKNY